MTDKKLREICNELIAADNSDDTMRLALACDRFSEIDPADILRILSERDLLFEARR